MYLENNYALVKQDIRHTSRKLSALFGHQVTDRDVSNFEQRHQSARLPSAKRRPRTAQQGAFGRRPINEYQLSFERDRYWPLYEDGEEVVTTSSEESEMSYGGTNDLLLRRRGGGNNSPQPRGNRRSEYKKF